jgi:outer membrane receptor for ferrienterochelin and colicin
MGALLAVLPSLAQTTRLGASLIVIVLLVSPRHALATDTVKHLTIRADLRSATALRVSSQVLVFDVTEEGESAVATVEYVASARTAPDAEVILNVEVLKVGGPAGAADEGETLTVAEPGGRTLLLQRGEAIAAHWVGGGTRAGQLLFTLRAGGTLHHSRSISTPRTVVSFSPTRSGGAAILARQPLKPFFHRPTPSGADFSSAFAACFARISGGFIMRTRVFVVLLLVFGLSSSAWAQGNPTGVIRGAVADPDGLALPGVTVTVTSPALQGARSVQTSQNGDFLVPFLPPGEYVVTFELQGFAPLKQTIGVAMAETQTLQIKLQVAAVTEEVTVTGSTSTEVLKTGTIAETYKAERIEMLPVGRTLESAVLLAPGVSNNGPSGNIVIAGALSYEGLYLINGVNVNENLRGQPRTLYIEDAIQETKVSVGNISAEYGRFNGGVVNMVTKSGGNNFSGSFRDSLSNDSWRALRPMGDTKTDKIVPAYEGTLGGPIIRDMLWFFGAGRYQKNQAQRVLNYTGLSYPWTQSDKRYEAKGTYAITPKNTFKASFTKRWIWTTNNTSNDPIDLDSLYSNGTADKLTALNYTSVLSGNLFFEAQYSRKVMATDDTGAQFTDLVKGTLMFDRSRGNARFNSPTFCAVCGSGWHEERNNWDWFAKLGYFLSTDRLGSHSMVVGFDNFKESRKVDNFQSGSGFRVYATKTYIADTPDRTIYPVIDSSSYIQYTPLVAPSLGSDIRTYSAFANDQWRLNNRLTFNVGFRFDRNTSKDQGGVEVLRDQQWSPRIGLSWDVMANGRWIANAGFARYVMGVNGAVVDSGSKGGRTASYSWNYAGPRLNATCTPPSCMTAADILPKVFAWFETVGGTNSTNYRSAPSIPGVTTKVGDTTAPSSNELTAGVAREIGGTRGTVRLDYTYRTYQDMYGSFVDTTTGRVTDETGRTYDMEIVKNTPDAKRWYHGLTAAVDYRAGRRTAFGGNYTLAFSKGNNDGENVGSGPVMASINTYPEYREETWNWPTGYMFNDQRHKARIYASYLLPIKEQLGQFTLGVVQRFDGGTPYDIGFSIDPSRYEANPGYLRPPTSITYYIDGRGPLRTDNVSSTDLSLVWTRRVHGDVEVFFRGLAYNIFNNQAVTEVNTTVSSNASPGSYTAASLPAFNPFTTTPQEGVNYRFGPQFGQPTAPGSFQSSRSANFSFGIRF